VKIQTNGKLRESRLFSTIPAYLKRSINTIFRIYAMYEPMKLFAWSGLFIFAPGAFLAARFLYYYVTGDGTGHIQSLILASVLMIVGFQIGMIGLVADLIGGNRRLLEDALYRIKKLELQAMQQEPNGFMAQEPAEEQ